MHSEDNAYRRRIKARRVDRGIRLSGISGASSRRGLRTILQLKGGEAEESVQVATDEDDLVDDGLKGAAEEIRGRALQKGHG